ncbi:hypothetical protein [Sphingobacterium sp. SYP-B4668]|uniref:hypothetical protein n=1 Tax=Sphingobacterium sp. SYP-B4668 TaxID=2996035 RepID=UPI0022DDCA33|nr:hypothetical protein [Sphingobacterium sp. SYP-B4668]
MKFNYFIFTLFASTFVAFALAQHTSSRHQFGANIGVQVGVRQETGYMMKIFANGGYGYEFNFAFPNAHIGAAFNLKTLSTRQEKKSNSKKYKPNSSCELVGGISSIFRIGPLDRRSTWTKDFYKGQAFYSYANLNQSPLMHPFHSSFAFGTQFIRIKDDRKQPMKQRVGFLNVKIHRFQAFFQNDGAEPFTWLGKTLINYRKDRYYTSSVMLSWHFPTTHLGQVNTLSFSFNKFTGEYGEAYRIANRLRNNTVDYRDTLQYAYNVSFVGVGVKLNDIGEISLRKYNPEDRLDPQNLIHYGRDMSYHINSTPGHWGLDVQRAFGILSNHKN